MFSGNISSLKSNICEDSKSITIISCVKVIFYTHLKGFLHNAYRPETVLLPYAKIAFCLKITFSNQNI